MHLLTRFCRSSDFLVVVSLSAAALADYLFFGHILGWTLGLFTLVLAAVVLLRRPAALRQRRVRFAGLFLSGLIVGLGVSPTPIAIVLAAAGLGVLALLTTSPWVDSIRTWAFRTIRLLINLVARLAFDNHVMAKWVRQHPDAQPAAVRVGKRWLIPVLLTALFVALFSAANPIIDDWLARVGQGLADLFRDWREYLRPERMALWVLVVLGTWGLLRPLREGAHQPVRVPPRLNRSWHRAAVVVRCLVLFNAAFLFQTVLDIVYLWAGATLPKGLTYAHYAHRGAYPLLATALLAGLFVLITFRRSGQAEQSPWARRLVYLWIAQNVFLMLSTIWRLKLYVDVYSLSRWRAATLIWMTLVALGFLWTIARLVLQRDNVWLLQRNVITLIAVLYLCAFVDFDGVIAWYNVQHCREIVAAQEDRRPVEIDLEYLRDLGEEALPALEWIGLHLEAHKQDQAGRYAAELRADLQNELADWRGWTFRRWSLARHTEPTAPAQEAAAAAP